MKLDKCFKAFNVDQATRLKIRAGIKQHRTADMSVTDAITGYLSSNITAIEEQLKTVSTAPASPAPVVPAAGAGVPLAPTSKSAMLDDTTDDLLSKGWKVNEADQDAADELLKRTGIVFTPLVQGDPAPAAGGARGQDVPGGQGQGATGVGRDSTVSAAVPVDGVETGAGRGADDGRSQPGRTDAGGNLSRTEAAVARGIGKFFGKRVVLGTIRRKGDPADNLTVNGVMYEGRVKILGDTIFIDVRSDLKYHTILGHELLHHLKQDNSELYQQLLTALKPLLKTQAYRQYTQSQESDAYLDEELIGDLLGDNFDKAEFWAEVEKQMGATPFRAFADKVVQWIDTLLGKLTNAETYQSEEFVTDLQAARAILAKGTAEYVKLRSQIVKAQSNNVLDAAQPEILDGAVRPSARTFREYDNQGYYDELMRGIEAQGYSPAKTKRFLKDIRSVAAQIFENQMLDYEAVGAKEFTALKDNSDDQYRLSEDYTTICRKTLKIAATISEIMKRNKGMLTAEQIFAVRKDLKDAGETVNCAVCYVFSRWIQIGHSLDQMAHRDVFILAEMARNEAAAKKDREQKKPRMTREEAGQFWDKTFKAVPQDLVYDLTRRHELNEKYPEAAKWLRERGAGLGKAIETRTEYIPGMLSKAFSPKQVRVQNLFSGMRMQSWSDFDPLHLIDMMQVAAERAKLGLMAHAYTKVPDFVRTMAPTGVFANMSLIPRGTGLTADGTLDFDDVEGMSFEEAQALRDEYPTAGIVAIGVTDEQIRAMLDHVAIDYIIPYHSSGLPKGLQAELGANWLDYERTQNDVIVDEVKAQARLERIVQTVGSKARAEKIMAWEWFDPKASPAKNSQNFLRYAAESGVSPRFEQFSDHPNYFKLLIDRRMYQGKKYLEQKPTTLDFDMKVITDIFQRYLDAPVEETTPGLSQPNQAVVDKWTRYSSRTITVNGVERPTTNSEGRPIPNPENFWNWFGDSKVVDAEGRPLVVYHGTNADFSVFGLSWHGGFHFGTVDAANARLKDLDGRYGKNVGAFYLKIENPLETEDQTSQWTDTIKRARDFGFDGLTYKNDWEGLKPFKKRPTDLQERPSNTYPAGVILWSDAFGGALADMPSREKAYEKLDTRIKRGGLKDRSTSWVAFDPTQIKSAIGNTGAFSPKTADIRYSERIPTEILELVAEAEALPKTHLIDTPLRWLHRGRIKQQLYGNGAKNKNRRADLVLGLPAAGKSTVADPLLKQHGALLIDPDAAKEKLWGFRNGFGASAVHKESTDITHSVLKRAMTHGDNIVYPMVGDDMTQLQTRIALLKENGYTVNLHYVDLPTEKAIDRVIIRHRETGRLVNPYNIIRIGLQPAQNFATLVSKGDAHETANWYNNDIGRGETPEAVEGNRYLQELPGDRGRELRGVLRQERADGEREEVYGSVEARYSFRPGEDPAAIEPLVKPKRTVLGNAINTSLLKRGTASLIGQKVKSADDLAELAQIFRNPAYETFRVFFVKRGKIVGQTGVSLRLPGVTLAFPGPLQKELDTTWFKQQMADAKADSYYLLHNHPSGRVTPSAPDVNLTYNLAQSVPGFKGHVIIDHNKYQVLTVSKGMEKLSGQITGREQTKYFGAEQPLAYDPKVPHTLLNREISSPTQLAEIGKELQIKDGYVTIVGVSAQNQIRGILEVPLKDALTPVRNLALARRFARQTGSNSLLAILPPRSNSMSTATSQKLLDTFGEGIKQGVLMDVITADGNSYRTYISPNPDGTKAYGVPMVGRDVGVRYSSRDYPLYSKLQQVVETKVQGKTSLLNLKAMLRNAGVSPVEIDNVLTGLEEKTLTKQEILDHVKANQTEFEDVVLGESVKTLYRIVTANGDVVDEGFEVRFQAEDKRDELEREMDQDLYVETSAGVDEITGEVGEETPENATHFATYTLPGANEGSYREMFVTAPIPSEDKRFADAKRVVAAVNRNYNEGVAVERELGMTYADALPLVYPGSGTITKNWQDGHSQYSSVKNPIVRIRYNVRGNTLFVEEIQGPSDANQQKMPEWLRRRIFDIGVKRVIALAKEQGFDGVAWTRGDQQAERYDLSKQVDRIEYFDSTATGQRAVNIELAEGSVLALDVDKASGEVTSNNGDTDFVGRKLEEVVGKEIAKKILGGERSGEITGDNLKVGGEGLKNLYDTMLPRLFSKYGKEKVGTVALKVTDKGYDEWAAQHRRMYPGQTNEEMLDAYDTYSRAWQQPFLPITEQTPSAFARYSAAWHGSPKRGIDRFDSKFIGTGEGAQAFGYGHYFSEAKEIAEYYRDKLSNRTGDLSQQYGDAWAAVVNYNAGRKNKAFADLDNLINEQEKRLNDRVWPATNPDVHRNLIEKYTTLRQRMMDGENLKIEGGLYAVELAPAEDEYLRWDLPLSEQSEKVKAALAEVANGLDEVFPDMGDGRNIYNRVAGRMSGSWISGERQKAASEYLHSLGIRGIKYPAETLTGSKQGDGTAFNYVVFSDDDVSITERYSYRQVIKEKFDDGADDKITQRVIDQYEAAGKFRTAFLDRYAPVKDALGQYAYELHRMLDNASTTIGTFLQHGKLTIKDDAIAMLDPTQANKGFVPWLHSLGKEGHVFLYWVAAKRAELLDAEGRENWLDAAARQDIFDEVAARGMEQQYLQWNDVLQDYNRNVIDLAVRAGLVDPAARARWMSDFYLPFYRLLENEATREEFVKAPTKSKAFINSGIKKLKGGEAKIGDPLANLIHNWSHLITESQRNIAASNAGEVMTTLGLAEVQTPGQLVKILGTSTQWGVRGAGPNGGTVWLDDQQQAETLQMNTPGSNLVERVGTKFGRKEDFGIMSYMKAGQPVYIKVSDPVLFNALTQVNSKAFDSTIFKVFSQAKRLLTLGATVTPAFRLANLFRDSISSWVIKGQGFTVFADSIKGMKKVLENHPDYLELMASGGGFGGGYMDSGDSQAAARHIHQEIKKAEGSAKGFVIDSAWKAWEFWQMLGHASEMATRVQLYSNMKAQGKGHMEAAFEARDIMDFALTGGAQSVRLLIGVTPFLNARMQGLDKLQRGAQEDPKGFVLRGLLVAAASMVLWSLWKDDERYKQLEDFDKWSYHHLWIGDTHVRLPKAFEVGTVFSTLFETAGNVAAGNEDWDFVADTAIFTLTNTFAVGLPQAIKPALEMWSNKSTFTGRPIESAWMQKLPAGQRSNPWTPEVLRDIGMALNVSPVKLQALLRGYTAAWSTAFLTIADIGYQMSGAVERPATPWYSYLGMDRFTKEGPENTKYATRFFEFANDAEMIYQSVNAYQKSGDMEAAIAAMKKNPGYIARQRFANAVNEQTAGIRKQERLIWDNKTMSGDEKKEKLDKLKLQKNKIYKQAYEQLLKIK